MLSYWTLTLKKIDDSLNYVQLFKDKIKFLAKYVCLFKMSLLLKY